MGQRIASLPEGAWTRTFVREAHHYRLSPRIMMAIGIIESYGGTDGTAYMGCLDSATYGSWPRQIQCAASVLARVGLAGYNPANPGYPAEVRTDAAGIRIVVTRRRVR